MNPNDPTEATQFANSEPGAVGLTIFFEVRPYRGQATYDAGPTGSGGSDAMRGVAAAAYNRGNTTNTDIYSGRPYSIYAATKNMSTVWNHQQDGSGTLRSSQANTLSSILAGAVDSLDCDGLIYSWVMALNFFRANTYGGQAVPYYVNVQNIFVGDVFFNSTRNAPSVAPSRQQFLNELGLARASTFGGGANPYYFWSISDAMYNGPFHPI